MTTKTLTGPNGFRIDLDRSQVFPDDPGAGTPAIVTDRTGEYSSTFWCALDTGELLGDWGDLELPQRVLHWLDDSHAAVEEFLYPTTGN